MGLHHAPAAADLLLGLLIGAMTVSGLSMIGERLRGQDARDMLGTAGTWFATLFASVVRLLQEAVVLTVVWYAIG